MIGYCLRAISALVLRPMWKQRVVFFVFTGCIFNLGSSSATGSKMHLRSEGQTLVPDEARVMTITQGFYHADWNAAGKGVPHQYDVKALIGALVVVDEATGLMWQRRGSSPKMMDRQEAEGYVRSLNSRKFGGFDDWRLPTLEEAMSLMAAPEDGQPGRSSYGDELRRGVFHINPAFETAAAYFMWTEDLESPNRGWVVYFWDGICGTEELRFHAYVRAVRSAA